MKTPDVSAFFQELRRRRVLRVAAGYLVGAWIVIQVTTTVAGPLGLPAWLPRVVIILLAAALPIVVLLAWTFDITPEGVRRTDETSDAVQADAPRRSTVVRRVVVSVAVVTLGVLAYAVVGRSMATADSAPDVGPRSIVVLPFDNMSEDQENRHFADGVTEEITAALAAIGEMSVTSRTSAMRYQGSALTLRQIGRELGVDYVLEGSVRRAGSQVRITAQLIEARTDRHIWSDTWERALTPQAFFAVQAEIAQAVARELRAAINPVEQENLQRRPTDDLAAYELYLEAIEPAAPQEDVASALATRRALLENAIELDPNFALAEAALAEVFRELAFVHAELAYENAAWTHVDRALATDSTLPEAWLMQARRASYAGQLEGAVQAARRALELRPSYAHAHALLAGFEEERGDFVSAFENTYRAWELEPTNATYAWEVGNRLHAVGAFDAAERWAKRARDGGHPLSLADHYALIARAALRGDSAEALARLDSLRAPAVRRPNGRLAKYWEIVADIEGGFGQMDSALSHYQRQMELLPDDADMTFIGWAVAERSVGNEARAEQLLAQTEEVARERLARYPAAGYFWLGSVAAMRGQREEAMRHFEEAMRYGVTDYWFFHPDNPRLREMVGYPPYEAFRARLEASMADARQEILERYPQVALN